MDGSPHVDFSPQQIEAIDAVKAWLATPRAERPQVFRLFGYAGTGKTTIARHLASSLHSVVYMAFTGKAALAMRRAGCEGASTIHSTIYKVVEDDDGSISFMLDPDSAAKHASLIVIDEVSMVGTELAEDILSFGRPVLVLGDPAQLPPVGDGGFFTECAPDIMLTEIHRQAADNPIIRLATAIRRGDPFPFFDAGEERVRIVRRGTLSVEEVCAADQVIVGRNMTRHTYNSRMRAHMGFLTPRPEKGERLVCLRNDRKIGLFNGGIYTVKKVLADSKDGKKLRLKISSEDFPNRAPFQVSIRREFFEGGLEELDWHDLKNTQRFDYGYALTCHKSQGSQWPSIIVYDESAVFRDEASRWLYTAVTRAQEKLTLVV